MNKKFIFIFLLFTTILSCKKSSNTQDSKEIEIPTFDNIAFNTIFSKEDSKIENIDSIHKSIQEYYNHIWENGNLWGGLLIAKGDNIIFEKYRGFSQDVNQGPISENTPLHVASISKTLTAMATLKMVEAKMINLEDTIQKFFPKFPYPSVTIKSLLNHRSGLPKYEYFIDKIGSQSPFYSKKFITNQDLLQILLEYKPEANKMPDTGFAYCNTNYALLALVIEKVTKSSFPSVMNKMIFKPLKMKNTFVFQEKDTISASKSFYSIGPKVYPYNQLDLVYGDKNVYTTPRDLYQFSKAMFSPKFLRKDLMDMVFEPYSNEKQGINNYGLGFRMKLFDNGSKLTFHTGWWHGSNAVFAHLRKSKVTIISIGNKFSKGPYSAISLSGLFEDFPMELEKFKKIMSEPKKNLKDSSNPLPDDLE